GIITVLFILNRDFSPEYKIPWIIFVLLMPLAGTCFYLIYGTKRIPKRFTKRMSKIINNRAQKILYHKDCSLKDPNHYKLARFVKNTSGNAIFRNTKVTYLSPGEMFYKELIKALREAKKFIFLEFYIIEEGKMWNSILKIIEEKVEEGIDVRLIYDDFGCMRKIPYNFKKKLTKKNIKTVNFNPFIPRLSTFLNYRDHRKIVVIDGNIGFTGGANIADEYINVKKLYGHWQDSAVMLEGDAVFSLTSLFLELWDFSTGENTDMKDYLPTNIVDSDGFIQVFGDSPFDNSPITANVYINIINNAKKYVYITTPYLIIDNEIFTALKNCAQSGIDVRIITPEIPDKKLVFSLTQSYYKKLIENGIKIYQYTPGFMHSKSILSDDHIAMIGSVNLDFRSLYLHFEVSCLLYQNEAIKDIKRDFENFFNVSRLITLKDIKKISIFQKVFAFFLKAFAPLL
ncbi:MAG TPA: cardiolipin synthase, partial [Acholeplasmataceae bacterium]|nr:cardiolipin synthase [Acholeplasmataceae bacterium]